MLEETKKYKKYLLGQDSAKSDRKSFSEKRIVMDLFDSFQLGKYSFISNCAPPGPDIQVDTADKKIGCELTELCWDFSKKGSITKKKERQLELIKKNIITRFPDIINNINIVFHLRDSHVNKNEEKIISYDEKKISNEIIQLLERYQHIFEGKSKTDIRLDSPNNNSRIQSINIRTSDSFSIYDSSLLTGRVHNEDAIKTIENSVEKKEEKKYLSSEFDELWLILFSPCTVLGNCVIIPPEFFISHPCKIKVKSVKFDRIIYYEWFNWQAHEIYPELKYLPSLQPED